MTKLINMVTGETTDTKTKTITRPIDRVQNTSTTNARLYDAVMQNPMVIGMGEGAKRFIFVPIDLLKIDTSYQRNEDVSKQKINWLANNWDDNAMEPLRVNPHPEEKCFYVIDGYHRMSAAKMMGKDYLVCEILNIPETEPEARRAAEAQIFVNQTKGRNPLSPVQKHKANILLNDADCVALQEVLDKYEIELRPHEGRGGGRNKGGRFSAYTASLNFIHLHGKELFETIIDILCTARWNLATDGFSQRNVRAIGQVLALHPDHVEEIKEEMIDYLSPMDPQELASAAHTAYNRRKEQERMTMHLEDVMAGRIGFPLVYKVLEREQDALLNKYSA